MSDNVQKNKQTEGLKQRMGKAYGKFAKRGSHWHWVFTMADSQKRMDGYDRGYLDTNYETFDRLKLRFFNGVLLNKHSERNKFYSELVAGGNVFLRTNPDSDNNKEDTLIFSFSLQWQQDSTGKSYRQITFVPNTQVLASFFTKGQINYINELFGNYMLEIRNQYLTNQAKKPNMLAMLAASIPDKNNSADVPQNPKNETPQPLAPHTQFAQMMAQVQTINADFHTFLCDCGFSFNHYEGNDLFVNIKNELFVQVIDSHIFANDLLRIIRNVFGSACKLHYRLAKQAQAQVHTQAKPETPLLPQKTFTLGANKRTGTTNIGKITATIPQTPKMYAEPQPTAQQKLTAAISKLAKFNNNYAIYLHNTLNYSKIENNTLFCMVTNQQAKEAIEKERDFADLCQYLKQAFEVQEVVLEVYTRKQNKL